MTARLNRVSFTAPLSPLLHTLHARAPAARWVAAGDGSETVMLAAATSAPTDWRYVTLQAVHELVEGAIHRHAGVTRNALDAHDIASLDSGILHNHAHSIAVSLETQLALVLEVDLRHYAAVVRGPLTPYRLFSAALVYPSATDEPMLAAAFAHKR